MTSEIDPVIKAALDRVPLADAEKQTATYLAERGFTENLSPRIITTREVPGSHTMQSFVESEELPDITQEGSAEGLTVGLTPVEYEHDGTMIHRVLQVVFSLEPDEESVLTTHQLDSLQGAKRKQNFDKVLDQQEKIFKKRFDILERLAHAYGIPDLSQGWIDTRESSSLTSGIYILAEERRADQQRLDPELMPALRGVDQEMKFGVLSVHIRLSNLVPRMEEMAAEEIPAHPFWDEKDNESPLQQQARLEQQQAEIRTGADAFMEEHQEELRPALSTIDEFIKFIEQGKAVSR